MTHIKAKPKDEQLKLDEVQQAMASGLEKMKDTWAGPELMEKIKNSPKLMAAFSDPTMNKILQDL